MPFRHVFHTYLVTQDGHYELYDNERDPYQMTSLDLESIAPQEAQMLQQELGRWLAKARDMWAKTHMNASLIRYPKK